VLTCFWSQDPQISLESVAQGPIAEMEKAARAGIQDTAFACSCQVFCDFDGLEKATIGGEGVNGSESKFIAGT
jgi:hypothetical protein